MKSEILKKLAELANELDTNGFYSEADAIDEIIKSAWGEAPMPAGSGAGGLPQVGPYEDPAEAHARMTQEQLQQFRAQHQRMRFPGAEITGKPLQHTRQKAKPDNQTLEFQIRYNTALQLLDRDNTGASIKEFEPYLKPDGIPGPRTKSARKSWALLNKKLQEMGQPSETEQRTGITPSSMKQQQLQRTVDMNTYATRFYRALMQMRPDMGVVLSQEKIRILMNDLAQRGMTPEQSFMYLKKRFNIK